MFMYAKFMLWIKISIHGNEDIYLQRLLFYFSFLG